MAAKKAKRTTKKSKAKATRKKPSRKPTAAEQELNRLASLLDLMKTHDLVELELDADGSVRFSKVGGGVMPTMSPLVASAPGVPANVAPTAEAANVEPAETEKTADTGLTPFLSPMVGTFYRAASPEAADYCSEGDRVEEGATLCIIEAMKVFNEIKAEFGGVVAEILVDNGEAVEYGQPLFMIRK